MTIYLHCPRCRLAVTCRATYLTLTNCPRCLARAALVSPLFASPLNGMELRGAEAPARAARTASARQATDAGDVSR
ncbi:MAG TPA: hypothetical protein VG474_14095 [Solirubrobacteraceae bacterium]|nr:hypothetical protein [Solirubrobacteraceae bacterium]